MTNERQLQDCAERLSSLSFLIGHFSFVIFHSPEARSGRDFGRSKQDSRRFTRESHSLGKRSCFNADRGGTKQDRNPLAEYSFLAGRFYPCHRSRIGVDAELCPRWPASETRRRSICARRGRRISHLGRDLTAGASGFCGRKRFSRGLIRCRTSLAHYAHDKGVCKASSELQCINRTQVSYSWTSAGLSSKDEFLRRVESSAMEAVHPRSCRFRRECR